jgi:hypothetical protein
MPAKVLPIAIASYVQKQRNQIKLSQVPKIEEQLITICNIFLGTEEAKDMSPNLL